MKRILSAALAVTCVMCASPPARAAGSAISVSNATASPGDYFDVTVRLTDNPGYSGMVLEISYDSDNMSLRGVKNGDVYTSEAYVMLVPGKYRLVWFGANGGTADGVLLTLTFKALGTAAVGSYPITARADAYRDGSEYILSSGATVTVSEARKASLTLRDGWTFDPAGVYGIDADMYELLDEDESPGYEKITVVITNAEIRGVAHVLHTSKQSDYIKIVKK